MADEKTAKTPEPKGQYAGLKKVIFLACFLVFLYYAVPFILNNNETTRGIAYDAKQFWRTGDTWLMEPVARRDDEAYYWEVREFEYGPRIKDPMRFVVFHNNALLGAFEGMKVQNADEEKKVKDIWSGQWRKYWKGESSGGSMSVIRNGLDFEVICSNSKSPKGRKPRPEEEPRTYVLKKDWAHLMAKK